MQVGGPGLSPTGIQGGHKLSNSFPAAPVACPPPPTSVTLSWAVALYLMAFSR